MSDLLYMLLPSDVVPTNRRQLKRDLSHRTGLDQGRRNLEVLWGYHVLLAARAKRQSSCHLKVGSEQRLRHTKAREKRPMLHLCSVLLQNLWDASRGMFRRADDAAIEFVMQLWFLRGWSLTGASCSAPHDKACQGMVCTQTIKPISSPGAGEPAELPHPPGRQGLRRRSHGRCLHGMDVRWKWPAWHSVPRLPWSSSYVAP